MEVELHQAIDEIDSALWDELAPAENPFLSHRFLAILERSGSAARETGWHPLHAVIKDRGEMLAVVPMYLKSHSYGEYVFDWGWADAFQRAGGDYYPKLQSAVPFTPVPGPRVLMRQGDKQRLPEVGVALKQVADRLAFSSFHLTFCTYEEWQALGDVGFLQRRGIQYHWENRDYSGFDDFLADLRSSKRKMIRKERRRVQQDEIEVRMLRDPDEVATALEAFYPFYLSTVDKRWGSAYLHQRFFSMLAREMSEKVAFAAAHRDGRLIAGALNLVGSDTLYGRNWGCLQDCEFLHFETCYYQAIEHAIAQKLQRVEAGAQGPHKLQRGYAPVLTYSVHYVRHESFRDAISRFLVAENREIDGRMEEMLGSTPFHRQNPDHSSPRVQS
ncbi:MAG: GNAT family N-acetyltransferase [Pseudomonadota bacterium]